MIAIKVLLNDLNVSCVSIWLIQSTYYAQPSPIDSLICTAVNEKIIPQMFLVKLLADTTRQVLVRHGMVIVNIKCST